MIHERLGYGGHSNVYRATFRGTDVAVKVMNQQYFNNESSLSRFEFEVAIMWYQFFVIIITLFSINDCFVVV